MNEALDHHIELFLFANQFVFVYESLESCATLTSV